MEETNSAVSVQKLYIQRISGGDLQLQSFDGAVIFTGEGCLQQRPWRLREKKSPLAFALPPSTTPPSSGVCPAICPNQVFVMTKGSDCLRLENP